VRERKWNICDCICFPNPYQTRKDIRAKYNMPTDDEVDCILACVCAPCFIVQNVKELAAQSGKVPKYVPDQQT